MMEAPLGGLGHTILPTPCCSGIRDPPLTRRPPPAEEAGAAPARARGSRQRPGCLRPCAPSARLLGCQHRPPSSGLHGAPDVAGTCHGGLAPSCPEASSAPAPQTSTLGPLLPPHKGRLDSWGPSWGLGDSESVGAPGGGRHLWLWEQVGTWRPAPVEAAALLGEPPTAAGELGPQRAPRGAVRTSAPGGRAPRPGRLPASAPRPRPAPRRGESRAHSAPGDGRR